MGSFAKVYKVKSFKTDNIYALKEIEKNKLKYFNSQNFILNEIEIMEKIHHKNIIKLHTYFED